MAKKIIEIDVNNLPEGIKTNETVKQFLDQIEEQQKAEKRAKALQLKKDNAIAAIKDLPDDLIKAYSRKFIITCIRSYKK